MVVGAKLNTKAKYYSVLFVLCVLIFFGIFSAHIIEGYSFIYDADALDLYFNFFVYEGEWLRSAFFSLVATGEFNPKWYTFDAGLGADILVTTAGCFNDPFNLVSFFVPQKYAEIVFEGLIFIRIFCAAATFSIYCFARGHSTTATICGALCYATTGYVVFWGALAHPNFINVSIVLPLILYGADKMFARNSPVVFIVSLAFSLLFSVYFSFMVCLVLLVYCIIKYAFVVEGRSVADFMRLFVRFLFAICAAFLLASFVVIPEVMTLTSMGRVGLERYVPILHGFSYYWGFVSAVFGASTIQSSLYIGVIPVICVAVLFVCRRRFPLGARRAWMLGFILCIVGALLPIVGHVMNGFGYVTDRWMFIYGFCAAYIVVMAVPVLPLITVEEWRKITCFLVPLFLIALLFAIDVKSLSTAFAAIMPAVAMICLVAACRFISTWVSMVVVAAIVANIAAASFLYNSSLGEGFVGKYVKAGSALAQIESMDFLGDVGSDPKYRVDRARVYGARNAALVNGFHGMDFYSSFYNQNVDDFNSELGMSGDYLNYRFNGFDSRFAVESLLAAKHYVVAAEHESDVPCAYCLESVEGAWDTYGVYETPYALPIGFIYEDAISRHEYDSANMVEKQELLTKGCIVEDAVATHEEDDLATVSESVEICEQSSLEVSEGAVVVSEPNASLTVEVHNVTAGEIAGEIYYCFEGLRYEPIDKSVFDSKSLADFLKTIKAERGSSATIKVSNGDRTKSFGLVNKYSSGYGGKDDFAVNLGSCTGDSQTYVIQFGRIGKYSFEDMYVAYQPEDAIKDNLSAIQKNGDLDLQFGNDSIEAAVPSSQSECRYVFFSIPYSVGWKASVDGKDVEIEKADTAFMAIRVDGSGHHVRLEYETPGLALGAACTCAGIAIVLITALLHKRLNARQEKAR